MLENISVKLATAPKSPIYLFDPKAEYKAFPECVTGKEFLEKAKVNQSCRLTDCSRQSLDMFCRIVRNANRQKKCIVVVEELGAYTNQGKAIGHWHKIVSQCLGEGMNIIATAQRAAEIDKTSFGNASYLHIAQQNIHQDRNYITTNTTLKEGDIPNEPLKWVQWSASEGKTDSGTIEFVGGKPIFKSTKKTKAKSKNQP